MAGQSRKCVIIGMLRRTIFHCFVDNALTHRGEAMFTTSSSEQFSNAAKGFLEAQFGIFSDLGSKTLASAEQLIALNLAAARACTEESLAQLQQLSAVRDGQSLLAQTSSQAGAGAEKAVSYGRHVAGIASDLQAHYLEAAQEQFKASQARITAMIEETARHAPLGGDQVASLLKTVIAKGNAGAEQLVRASKDGAKALEDHVTAVSNQLSGAANKSRAE